MMNDKEIKNIKIINANLTQNYIDTFEHFSTCSSKCVQFSINRIIMYLSALRSPTYIF